MRFLGKFAGALALIALFIAGGFWALGYYVSGKMKGPDPVSIAGASLESLKEQNRLSAFTAGFVSVTTSTQSQFGLSAKKTLIMPGMVRYEVDLGKLRQKDVTWDAKTHTLGVVLPPVEVIQPQIDLTRMREYGEGGILSVLTDADARLQEANRIAGQQELVRQAHQPTYMNLARDATRRAVERSFAMPLKAAGMDVTVKVRFSDEPKDNDSVWDSSRSLQDVFANRF